MKTKNSIQLISYQKFSEEEMLQRAANFFEEIRKRRTVRDFSDKPIPREIIELCIKSAGTAPSGANLQPWHFVVVSDPQTKKQIRAAAEKEEKEFYKKRAPKEWLKVLAPLGTNEHKSFLEKAPYLIAVFYKSYELTAEGKKQKTYYAIESTGIAAGILITALHHAGLVTLTHTPSPMGFLNKILNRPINEKPFLLLVTGYPIEKAVVPNIKRKKLDEIATFI